MHITFNRVGEATEDAGQGHSVIHKKATWVLIADCNAISGI